MTIRVKIDVPKDLLAKEARQIPFAISQAVNDVLKQGQKSQVAAMRDEFTIRKPDFLRLNVKITEFANKTTLAGTIAIAPPGSAGDIFGKFEDGRDKVPHNGREHLAVPRTGSIIKPRKNSIIADHDRPGALLKSPSLALRTFVRPYKKTPGREGIFGVDRAAESRAHETGKKRDRNRARPRLLYALIPKAPIKEQLHFLDNVTKAVRENFKQAFAVRFEAARKTAR